MTSKANSKKARPATRKAPTGRVSKKEWRDAVHQLKWGAYINLYCTEEGLWNCHHGMLKLLEENPRLAKSEFGKNYIRKTEEVKNLLEARSSLERVIENMLADGFGALSLKYWDPAKLPKGVREEIEKVLRGDPGERSRRVSRPSPRRRSP